MKNLKWIIFGSVLGIMVWLSLNSLDLNLNNIEVKLNHLFKNTVENKELIIANANTPMGLDPAVVTDNESFKVTTNIYETLVKYDKEGSMIIPGLAESWSMSEDGLVWQFKIRDGIYFHDGTPLDAGTIAFNFNRWMDEKSIYHTGYFSYWNMSFSGFPGIVNHVNALSNDVLEIQLNKPYAPFLSTLTMPAFGIASPDIIKGFNEELKNHPVGTGPFIFSEWDKEDTIVLRRNDHYWGSKAKVDTIKFLTVPNRQKRLDMLANGEVHIIDVLTKYGMQEIKEMDSAQLIGRQYFNIGYLSLNMKNKYLSDINIRKAIAHGIDREIMMRIAYDELARPANSFVPPALWGHNETIKALDYNRAKAKSYIRKADVEESITLELLVMNTPRKYFPKPIDLARYIATTLELIGIDVNVTVDTWEAVIKRRNNGDYDMILAGWNGDIVDPDNFLYTIFASSNLRSGLSNNYSFYSNEKVDYLLEQARQATDNSFRMNLYREVQEYIHNDVPAIPLVHTMTFVGMRDNVLNYYPSISGAEVLNNVDVKGD